MTKEIKIILVIAIIIIIVGFGFIFWPKQDQPSNTNQPVITEPDNNQPATTTEPEVITTDLDMSRWVEYNYIDWGLNFKYPNDWEVKKMLGELVLRPKDCPEVPTGYRDDYTWGSAISFYRPSTPNEATPPENSLLYIEPSNRKDTYYKNGEDMIHKIIWVDGSDKKEKAMIVVRHKELTMEIRTSGQCLSLTEEIKFLDAMLTTLK